MNQPTLAELQDTREALTDEFIAGRLTRRAWKRALYSINRAIDARIGRAPYIAVQN